MSQWYTGSFTTRLWRHHIEIERHPTSSILSICLDLNMCKQLQQCKSRCPSHGAAKYEAKFETFVIRSIQPNLPSSAGFPLVIGRIMQSFHQALEMYQKALGHAYLARFLLVFWAIVCHQVYFSYNSQYLELNPVYTYWRIIPNPFCICTALHPSKYQDLQFAPK